MPADFTDDFVKQVRELADVPRVRSSEVRKIIEAMATLTAKGSAPELSLAKS